MRSIYASLSLLVIFFLAVSCVKETIDLNKISNTVNWNPAYGAPVATGSLSMSDILSKVDSTAQILEYSDSLLYLTYSKQLLSEDGNTVMQLPDQEFSQSFQNNFGQFLPVGDSIRITQIVDFDFALNDSTAMIDSIFFKSGLFSSNVYSSFMQNGSITMTFDKLTKNGVPLVRKAVFSEKDSTSTYEPTDLTGYKLQLNSSTNKMSVTFKIVLNNNPPKTLVGNEKISVSLKFQLAKFKIIYGYLGTLDLINSSATNSIELFQNKNNRNVEIANPVLSLYIKNSFGVPINLRLSNTYTESETNGRMDVTFDTTVNPVKIKIPSISNPYLAIKDSTHITKSNSNLFEAIATIPQKFNYTLSGESNPKGKTGVTNFITDSSKLNVKVSVELPLELKAGSLILDDTVSFDLTNMISDFSILNRLAVYSSYENGMPFDLKLSVKFVDKNYVEVDSLYDYADQPALASAVIGTTGKVIQSTTKITQTIMDAARAQKMNTVKYAIVSANLATIKGGTVFVKFLSGYQIKVAFQIQTELQVHSIKQF